MKEIPEIQSVWLKWLGNVVTCHSLGPWAAVSEKVQGGNWWETGRCLKDVIIRQQLMTIAYFSAHSWAHVLLKTVVWGFLSLSPFIRGAHRSLEKFCDWHADRPRSEWIPLALSPSDLEGRGRSWGKGMNITRGSDLRSWLCFLWALGTASILPKPASSPVKGSCHVSLCCC